MHVTYLSGIERGKNNPSWTKLTGLATALDIPVWPSPALPKPSPLRIP